MIKSIEQFGLKLIDMIRTIKSIKMTWIKHTINNPTSSWKLIIYEIVGWSFEYLLGSTEISKQNHIRKATQMFWNVMHDLKTLHNYKRSTISEIMHETLWLNRNITVDHNTVFWNCCFRSGNTYVGDMLNSVVNFISQDELFNKYKINCSFIDYLRIRQALPGLWRHILELPQNKLHIVQTCQQTSIDI